MDTHNEKISSPLLGLGVLILLTIGALLLPASWFGIEPAKKTYSRVDLSDLNLSNIANDGDADGSISWKELVTDSLRPEDIAQLENQKPDASVIANLNDQNNLTASFSKNLYAASAYLAKNQLNDPLAEQEIINQLINKESEKVLPAEYTLKDMVLATNEDKKSIRSYGNEVSSILGDMITQSRITKDFEGLTSFLNSNNEADLAPLQEDAKRVDAKLSRLLSLPVPMSAATYHVLILTRVAAYRDTLYNLSKASEDPVRAMLFIQKYPETTLSALKVFSALSPYFDIQNVVFSPKEPGYVFTVGYTLK